jgi:dolichol-phosphate mannosyltransferase
MNDCQWQLPIYERLDLGPRRCKYALLVPVINEGERIRKQLVKMEPYSELVDIFIVDGGSTDGSLKQEYLCTYKVRTLLIKIGPGKLSAQIRIGLACAMADGYEGAILIDGNNKDNPDAIPHFIQVLEEGVDHVQGSRFIPGGKAVNTPLFRLLGIKLLHAPLISMSAGIRYTDTTNGFRAYSRQFLLDRRVAPFRDVFSAYELHYYLAIRAACLGFKVKEVPVERSYPSGKIPTKIKGFKGNIHILKSLVQACLHKFDPLPENPGKGRQNG